jgi:hypothetical protein
MRNVSRISTILTVPGLIILLLFAGINASATSPSSVTFTVCAEGCDFSTIQTALDHPATPAGATLVIIEPVHTESGIVISKDITIQGRDHNERSIVQAHVEEGKANDRVFLIEEGVMVTLHHLTIQHGRAPRTYPPSGGGIYNYGNLTLENCIIRKNSATDGGGILNNGNLTLKNCTLINNTADGIHPDMGLQCGAGGAIKSETGRLNLNNCILFQNTAAEDGGGVFISCKSIAEIVDTTISENAAREDGGGIHIRGTLNLHNSIIQQNSANRLGGGIFIHGKLEFANNTLAQNTRSDCYLVTEHPYKGVGTILLNSNNYIADQSCL